MTITETAEIRTQASISPAQVWLLALIAGLSVASLYYIQPLLDTVASDFGLSSGHASLAVTATQVGYVIGLAALVPLGDKLNRRTLLTTLIVASAAVLALTAVVPSFWLLLAAWSRSA